MEIKRLIWGYKHEAHIELEFTEEDKKRYNKVKWEKPIAIIVNSKERGRVNGIFLYNGEDPSWYESTDEEDTIYAEDKERIELFYDQCVLNQSLKEKWEKWDLFKPMEVGPNTEEDLIEAFERTGSTSHSGRGSLVGIVLKHCVDNKIPFKMEGYPGGGYYIEKIKDA